MDRNLEDDRDEQHPVQLRAADVTLFGMFHRPRRQTTDAGVVFLSSGLQSRAGPHRIYVKTARSLSSLGLPSVRIDLPGVGDSEGEVLSTNFDCHRAEPVRTVVDFVRSELGLRRVLLLGLCAGARVAFKAAARDPRVEGVIAWSVPVISGSVDMPVAAGGAAYMSKKVARAQLRYWAPKLISPGAWARYVSSGKSLKEARRMAERTFGALLPERFRAKSQEQTEFFRSIESYIASKRRGLILYGALDKIPLSEFTERFGPVTRNETESCNFAVIPGGNHIFSSPSAEHEVIENTKKWIERHFVG
jgi:pimeloyl-ACP methyl ester carboxylesterase